MSKQEECYKNKSDNGGGVMCCVVELNLTIMEETCEVTEGQSMFYFWFQ